MKALFGHLGMTALVYLTLTLSASAQFTYITNADNTITITAYSGTVASVTIPSNVNGRTVTRLGDESFRDSLTMTSVVIPGGVTNIGVRAFYLDSKLTSVSIPNSVTRLGNMAFMGCSSLSNLSLGNSIASIEDETFRICTNLLSVAIPNSVASIGANAFRGCHRMTNLTFGTGLKILYDSAFRDCDALRRLSIPGNVTNTGYSAFSYCSALQNVIIENGVKTIGEWSFLSCEALTNVTIGSSVTKIDNVAFGTCSALLGVYFSGNAPSIGTDPFSGCNSATVYRLASATNWPTVPNLWAGRPTALWPSTTLAINPSSTNLSSAAASGKTIGVTASVAWTAVSNVSWITITGGASGSGNGTVTFSVITNSAASRTGRIVVAGGGISLTCTVTQAGLSAPAAPTGVSATDGTYTNQIQVSWAASSGATGYEVRRFTNSNPNLSSPIATGIAAPPYNDTNVTAGRVYYYWLKATNAAGASTLSSSNSGYARLSPPSAPANVLATDGAYSNKVRVTWSASSGATGYEVWRHTSNNSNTAGRIKNGISDVFWDDATVTAGTNYYYWVKATNAGGTSVFSNVDSGYASNSPPAAPTGVSASDGTYSDRIRITWTPSAGATGYGIWRSTNNASGSATNIAQGIVNPPYDDLTAPQGITNFYWVKATNAIGASPFSASDSGLRSSTSFTISGMISYGGSQTGLVQVMASPSFVGQPNIALTLDGVDDHVYVQNPSPVLQLTNRMTICAWACVTGQSSGTYSVIMVKMLTTPSPLSYVMAIDNSTRKPYVGFGDGRNYNASLTLNASNGWTHLAFSHDGTVGRWYINGQFSSATTNGPIHRYGDGPFSIGAYVPLESYFNRFPGQLDDVALWTNALTQGQIQSVMSNGVAGSEPGLVACWNFDDGTANDLTTNANHGQFMAGATTANRSASGSPSGATLASPGGYSVTNVLAGEYDIRAYRDSNGNGNTEPWEAYGTYPANTLSVTGNMANIDITLQDPISDTDGDGVTDYDEIYLYGSSWTNSDTDADGMLDGDEVLAGSSPTNDASMFGFADALPVPEGGGVVVSWPSLSNRVYRLERTTNLLLDFEPLATDIPADPPVNSYTDATPNVVGAYKVGVRME